MKGFSKAFLSLMILLAAVGCNKQHVDRATITIESPSQRNAEVKLSLYNPMDDVTLVESTTDSAGNSHFEVTVTKPMFVSIQIGNKYGEVYLEPEYNLVIQETGQDYKIPLTFSGKGAQINNYVSWVNSNVEKIKWANGRGLNQLEYTEFLHRFDSLKKEINGFHASYTDSVHLPPEAIAMLERKNNIKFSEVGQEFKFYKLNNSMIERLDAQRNGLAYLEFPVPEKFTTLTNEIPLDPELLTNGYHDYQLLLNYYWHNTVDLPVSEELLLSKAPMNQAALKTNAILTNGKYPDAIREYLIAFNLQYWLAALGINPEIDSVFARVKRTYPNSSYLPALIKGYNEWLAIAPGKPAPEFEGHTPEGKKVSITDLKGKVVYIDIWATWCGPCVAEIPASKELQREFLNDDRIQFLNVSIDSRRSDWENFLSKDKSWKGLHLIIDPDKIQSLYTTYKLFGVPDYILIDQAGNIVDMKAPRPSEHQIKAKIKQLLTIG